MIFTPFSAEYVGLCMEQNLPRVPPRFGDYFLVRDVEGAGDTTSIELLGRGEGPWWLKSPDTFEAFWIPSLYHIIDLLLEEGKKPAPTHAWPAGFGIHEASIPPVTRARTVYWIAATMARHRIEDERLAGLRLLLEVREHGRWSVDVSV